MSDLSNLLLDNPARRSAGGSLDEAYGEWRRKPSPDSMQRVIRELDTTITSEVQRFSGPKPLLRSRAKALAVKAVKSFDPAGGARLRSWVTTQLQPLSRYNNSLKPVYAPEEVARKSYAISKAIGELTDEIGRQPTDEELADRIGVSVKRLKAIRGSTPATVNTPQDAVEDDSSAPEYAIYQSSPVGGAADAVYGGLNARDRRIFDMRTGSHGEKEHSGNDIASLLNISPALVTRRANTIAEDILKATERMQR